MLVEQKKNGGLTGADLIRRAQEIAETVSEPARTSFAATFLDAIELYDSALKLNRTSEELYEKTMGIFTGSNPEDALTSSILLSSYAGEHLDAIAEVYRSELKVLPPVKSMAPEIKAPNK